MKLIEKADLEADPGGLINGYADDSRPLPAPSLHSVGTRLGSGPSSVDRTLRLARRTWGTGLGRGSRAPAHLVSPSLRC